MIQITHATQQALARIATSPATSEQCRRSPLATEAMDGDPAFRCIPDDGSAGQQWLEFR
jgi:hypothetical protein